MRDRKAKGHGCLAGGVPDAAQGTPQGRLILGLRLSRPLTPFPGETGQTVRPQACLTWGQVKPLSRDKAWPCYGAGACDVLPGTLPGA